jgi:hypothetical protein
MLAVVLIISAAVFNANTAQAGLFSGWSSSAASSSSQEDVNWSHYHRF